MAGALLQLLIAATQRAPPLQLVKYLREVMKLRGDERDLRALAKQFPEWSRSVRLGRSALADGRPWIPYSAARFLEEILRPDARVFEFGAGGSTLFFAERVRGGVSVEHDAQWAQMTRAALTARGLDWKVVHAPPEPDPAPGDPSDPDRYASHDPEFAGRSFRAYVNSLEGGPFDLVTVDGRARPACIARAIPLMAPGGWIFVDNSDRQIYRPAQERLRALGWRSRRFTGPTPYLFPFSVSCAWQRPA